MKHLFIFTILFFAFSVSASAQCTDLSDCNAKIEKLSKAVQKLIAIETADKETISALQNEISALKLTVKELEAAKQTPCSVQTEKFKSDAVFWTDKFNSAKDETERKQIAKTSKFVLKTSERAVKAQCGYSSDKSFARQIWNITREVAPLAAIILAAR